MGTLSFVHRRYAYSVPKALRGDETKPFDVDLPIQQSWNSAKRRMLIVYQTVDTQDLKSKKLLSDIQGTLLPNLLKYAQQYSGETKLPSLAAINFDYFRNRHLTGKKAIIAKSGAVGRIRRYIEATKPTDVFVIGSEAAELLMGLSDYEEFMGRGRVRKIDGIYWCHGPDVSQAYQNAKDDDAEDETRQGTANLAGFLARCLSNALHRGFVHRIEFKPDYVLIDTIDKWRKFNDVLKKTDHVAVDLESTSLGRKVNKILTIQFAFNAKRGYVLPVFHKDTPFNEAELKEIRSDLRVFFGRDIDYLNYDPHVFLLGQNLKFDMTVLREWLNLHVIKWPLWDLMAGEYLLDENMQRNTRKIEGRNKTSYSLNWIAQSYGCDFYDTNEFGKEDRGNIASYSLSDKPMLRYTVADVQLPWLIREKQIARAQRQIIEGKPYKDSYIRMMLTQMRIMIHVQSMMEHRGDHLDVEWLNLLLQKEGPLDKAEVEYKNAFHKFKSVRRVNAKLLKEQGLNSKSIFGGSNWVFSVTKSAHKQLLFFKELALKPLSYGKSKLPKVDKAFQEAYKESVPEVKAFAELAQVGKVRSTYVRGFLRKLKTDADMLIDHCLRASYGFVDTVTGRSNSYDPLFA